MLVVALLVRVLQAVSCIECEDSCQSMCACMHVFGAFMVPAGESDQKIEICECMQSRYQGVNWLDESLWNCNDGQNPFNSGASDVYSLHPMELMFVKVKHWPLTSGYPSMLQAVQYDAWSAAAAKVRPSTGHAFPRHARARKLLCRGISAVTSLVVGDH